MLSCALTFVKPSIVGHIDNHLRPIPDKFASQARHRILKTDRWNRLHLLPPNIKLQSLISLTCRNVRIVLNPRRMLIELSSLVKGF